MERTARSRTVGSLLVLSLLWLLFNRADSYTCLLWRKQQGTAWVSVAQLRIFRGST